MAEFTQVMSGDSRYSIKLTVTEVIPSDYITTNKTNVNYTLIATKSGGSGYWSSSAINPVKVTINGTDVVNTNISYDFRNATPKTITLASGTVTGISHNADGTKTIAVSGYFKDSANSLGQATASGNLTLTTIPRASQPTLYDLNDNIRTFATLGENLKIEIARASSNFKHTLQIKIGNSVVETFTNVGAEKNPWSPAISTYTPYITSGSSTTATIVCTTYNGSTSLGTKSQTITINVPNNASTKPTVEITASEGNSAVPSSWGVYVKGKSKLSIALKLTPKYSTKINSCSSNANNNSYSWTNSDNTSGVITKTWTTNELTGNGTITASVSDKRGFSNSASSSYTIVDYSNPQITTYDAYRCNSDGKLNDSGTCIKWTFKGSISSVNSKNSKTFTLKYKPSGSSEVTVGTWTDSYSCDRTAIIQNLSASTEYTFTFTATDQFSTTTSTKVVGTGFRLMNFNGNGRSMAFGGVSQRGDSEKAIDVFMDTEFHKDIKANVLDLFNDTSGSDWQTMMKNKLDYCINNINTSKNNAMSFINGGWSGNNYGFGIFSKIGTSSYQLVWFSNIGYTYYVQKYNNNYTYKAGNNITVASANSASSATKATQDSAGNNLITTRSFAMAIENNNPSFDDVGSSGRFRRSGLYSTNVGNVWYNLINVRHRNGESDGTGYGLQIRSAMTTSNIESARLQYRNQYTANGWTGWQTITPDSLRGCAMLKLTSNYNFTATAWADTQVAFSGRSSLTNSNSTLFEQSGNGIKCKFSGWVQVVGAVGSNKTNEFDASILKGSTQIIRAINSTGSQSFATAVFQVATNDVVYLSFASDNTSGTIYNGTHFTITRIN